MAEKCAHPSSEIAGDAMPPPEFAPRLRAKAKRARQLAAYFEHDEAAARIRALADELEARAEALDVGDES